MDRIDYFLLLVNIYEEENKSLIVHPLTEKVRQDCLCLRYTLSYTEYILFTFQVLTKESVETLSALEIAEQMTYLDYQIISSINSE